MTGHHGILAYEGPAASGSGSSMAGRAGRPLASRVINSVAIEDLPAAATAVAGERICRPIIYVHPGRSWTSAPAMDSPQINMVRTA